MFLTGGGASNITGAQVVDASLSTADLSAAAILALEPTALTVLPQPNFTVLGAIVQKTLSVNTTLSLGQVIVPTKIVANSISFIMGAVTVAGVAKICLFSEDGQTQIFSVSTASISASNTVVTTALSAVTINAGVYWIAFMPTGTANINPPVFDVDTAISNNALRNTVSGKPIIEGVLTVTANTMPATITPTSVTVQTQSTLIFRLDN